MSTFVANWRCRLTVGVVTTGFALAAQSVLAGPQGNVPVQKASSAQAAEQYAGLLKQYCVTCHSDRAKIGNLSLEPLTLDHLESDAVVWEKVVRKLRAGVMPPVGRPRPDEAAYSGLASWLEEELDRAASKHPDPGRTESFHRLNRAEYHNAIRDLLALDVDVSQLLPADDASYGFDNVASGLRLSQSLLEGYLAAGKKISRTAVGGEPPAPESRLYVMSRTIQQHDRIGDLPFGTRGGTLVQHFFPRDGEYEIEVEVSTAGMFIGQTDQLEITIDGEQVKLVTVGRPRAVGKGNAPSPVQQGSIDVRLPIKAGPRAIGVTFYRTPISIVEDLQEPVPNPEMTGHVGGLSGPKTDLKSVRVAGPIVSLGPGNTPSRARIFICQPSAGLGEKACAEKILLSLARRAFRRPVHKQDVQELLGFFERRRNETGMFDAGIELALWRLLISPEFLYRIEAVPSSEVVGGSRAITTATRGDATRVYAVSNLDLASRLSFFLWSSIPDDELLTLAETGKLREPAVLEWQVRRMLKDPRALSLAENFAGQWLQLRNIARVKPGDPYYVAFDETLRAAMRRETELLFDSIIRENRSVMDLLNANYAFLNERLALHYGIPNVQGSHFRRVALPPDSPRRGILGNASVLTITSQAIRTSPVVRGKWLLTNILGTPPPDPPPNVPALEEKTTPERQLSMRERMAQHRKNPVCASCHAVIDPAGFALENFDAIGRWRLYDESHNAVDTSGALPDGTQFKSFVEFRAALVGRPERFATTVAERLLTYALGRGLEYYDMPVVRQIVRESATHGYRIQTMVTGIVKSYPFLMRRRADQPLLAVSR